MRLLVQFGKVEAWMVCIVLAREFIISGFRLIAASNGIVIKEYRTININRANTFIMRELKIGFLQQHNVEDIKNNIERLAEGITNLAQRGAELF